jgi:hypothetical protein
VRAAAARKLFVCNDGVLETRMHSQQRRVCGKRNRLRLFGITKTGLLAITLAVVALWTCIAMEASTRLHAEREVRASLYKLRKLRQDAQPAAAPIRLFAQPRPTAS